MLTIFKLTSNCPNNRAFMMLKFINIAIVIVAVLAAYFLFFVSYSDDSAPSKPTGHIKAIVPASPDGWASKDLPLGPTEEAQRAAEKILASTEFLNREFTSPDGKFTFVAYIAYWKRGAANGKVVSDHTPDKCWVMNGWKNDKSKARSDVVFEFDGMKLIPAFYRRMTFNNLSNTTERFVCFWHMMDGTRYEFGDSATFYNAFSFDYLKGAFLSVFKGAPEMYFIRIDSPSDFPILQKEKAFQEVVKSLGKLILEQKNEVKK